MKTHLLTLLVAVATVVPALGQSFVIDWAKPNPIHGTPTGGTVKRDGTIRNLTETQRELYFTYDLSGLSLDHTAQLCMNLCWSLMPGPDDPFIREGQILPPNGTLAIYVDLTPRNSEGTSVIAVSLFDGNNMTDKIDFVVEFEISPTASVADAASRGVTVGPLPTSQSLSVRGNVLTSVRSMGLYDVSGTLVRSFGTGTGTSTTLPLAGVAAGTYRLVFVDAAGSLFASPVVVAP